MKNIKWASKIIVFINNIEILTFLMKTQVFLEWKGLSLFVHNPVVHLASLQGPYFSVNSYILQRIFYL